jgi:hypothetical protein
MKASTVVKRRKNQTIKQKNLNKGRLRVFIRWLALRRLKIDGRKGWLEKAKKWHTPWLSTL